MLINAHRPLQFQTRNWGPIRLIFPAKINSPEITRSAQHGALGTKNVSDNITGVKADADAAAAAAEEVNDASQTLETRSQQLGNQVTDFLEKIRAA